MRKVGNDGKDDLRLAYDADNRIVKTVRILFSARHSAHYFYDPFSRRTAKRVTVEQWGFEQTPGATAPLSRVETMTLFVWDGDTLAQELRQHDTVTYLYEPDSFIPLARITSGGGWDHPAKDDHFAFVPQWQAPSARLDSTLQRKIAAQESDAEQRHQAAWSHLQQQADDVAASDRIDHYHCDHLGTPRELIDQHGKLVWGGHYKAWGRLTSVDYQLIAQPLRFQGQYEDQETGLHYNRYRYYDPEAGRYFTQDPIGILGGLNSYQYAPNPVTWIDPQGLAKKCSAHTICDPCEGKNPSAMARKWQGSHPYIGVDSYKNMALQKGTTIYALYHPAQGDNIPSYFLDGKTMAAAGWNHKKLHDLVQVQSTLTDPTGRPPRVLVRKYIVMANICVATGKASRNGRFGSGGGYQIFIPETEKINLLQGSTIGLR